MQQENIEARVRATCHLVSDRLNGTSLSKMASDTHVSLRLFSGTENVADVDRQLWS
jgi:hypothetical protein